MSSHKNMPKAVLHSLKIILKIIWKMPNVQELSDLQ